MGRQVPFDAPLSSSSQQPRSSVQASKGEGAATPASLLGAGDKPVVEPDLESKELRGADLSGRDLSGRDLSGADLSRANLRGATLLGAELKDANLFGADLDEAECSGADFSGALLRGVRARRAGFGMANLEGASFALAELEGASFTKAKLVGADFSGVHARQARFSNADLSGAQFEAADLQEADLSDARVGGATFRRCDLRNAALRAVRGYTSADWIDTDVRDTNFTGAHLCRRFILDQNFLEEFKSQGPFANAVYWIWYATSDCGRSLVRWALWTIALAAVFGALYSQVDVRYANEETWLSPFYFSVVTLTTLGYGDAVPVGAAAQGIAMLEVVLGYMMLGGVLSIFSNKMARRAD